MIRLLLGAAFLLAILDIVLLFWIGLRLGFVPVLAIVFLPSTIGGGVARQQGAQSLRRAHEVLGKGLAPSDELLDSAALLLASLFLLYPGPVSTAVGLVLLVPWPRRRLARFLFRNLKQSLGIQFDNNTTSGTGPSPAVGPRPAEAAPLDEHGLKRVEGEDLGSSPLPHEDRGDLAAPPDARDT